MRRLVPIAAATWCLLTAAACASSDSESPTPPSEPAAPAATTEAATEAPAEAAPTEAAPAEAHDASPVKAEVTPDGMAAIPAGKFLIGSHGKHRTADVQPQHERIVPGFYIDKTEVTVAAYRACVDAGKCTPAHDDKRFCNGAATDKDDHPINCVDHHQAKAYCSFAGKRLPTETEWEYAGRGGQENRKYSWGNHVPNEKIACYNHPGGTCKTASFEAGAFGLHDMAGNVWEWTDSWYGPYPEVHANGTHRVFKGGSWSRWQPHWLLARNRSRWPPEQSNPWLGFRCAKDMSTVTCPSYAKLQGGRCVRTEGEPLCPEGTVWSGEYCAVGHAGGPRIKVDRGWQTESGGPLGASGPPDEKVVRTRTPGFDADCQRLYKFSNLPRSYQFAGSTWHKRIKVIASHGCKRRDTGPRSTSTCCPG